MLKVVIALISAEMPRFACGYESISSLQKPFNTFVSFARGCSPAENRNNVVKKALEEDASHILFVDDDMTFQPNALLKLLEHDKDMVSGYYLQRGVPFRPLLMDKFQENMEARWFYPNHNDKGLKEVVATGAGFLLCKTEVFKYSRGNWMDAPWFTLGQIDKVGWSDDIHFFYKCYQAGLKLYVDLDLPIGHMALTNIWPDKKDGKWIVTLDCNGRIPIECD